MSNSVSSAPVSALRSVSPNVRLLESLRHTGYNNYSAISDLIDNSVDAGAKNVHVFARIRNGQPEIMVVDDGSGMNQEFLAEAMRLASDTDHDDGDLGKFGMGLNTASLSIARSLTVLTRDKSGVLHKAVMDIDDMMDRGSWECFFGALSAEEETIFNEYVPHTGTVIYLQKCDRLSNNNLTSWKEKLAKEVGQTFRKVIDLKQTKLYIGSDIDDAVLVPKRDPLERDHPNTEIVQENFIFEYEKDGVKCQETVYLEGAFLDQNGFDARNKENGGYGDPGMRYQGCYLIRNNREIVAATWFDHRVEFAGFNYLRCEISFTNNLDEFFSVSFKKDSVSPIQSLRDKIMSIVKPWMDKAHAIARGRKTEKTSKTLSEEVQKPVEAKIKSKVNLLKMPKAAKGTREYHGRNLENQGKQPTGTGHVHTTSTKSSEKLAKGCRFEAMSRGPASAIYEAEKEGKVIVVRWNSDHPFYQTFIAKENGEGKELLQAFHYFIFSLANAELSFVDDSEDFNAVTAILDNFKANVSNSMRTLLS